MRLIDANVLVQDLGGWILYAKDCEEGNNDFINTLKTAIRLIEQMPTVYDTEKVVQKLKENSISLCEMDWCDDRECVDCDYYAISHYKAVEIVQDGGE